MPELPKPSVRARPSRSPPGRDAQPSLRRGLIEIATSLAPYVALSVLMYLTLDVSALLTVALIVPTAGFLVRVIVVFHDCAHGRGGGGSRID